jgi:hypothetical protein
VTSVARRSSCSRIRCSSVRNCGVWTISRSPPLVVFLAGVPDRDNLT